MTEPVKNAVQEYYRNYAETCFGLVKPITCILCNDGEYSNDKILTIYDNVYEAVRDHIANEAVDLMKPLLFAVYNDADDETSLKMLETTAELSRNMIINKVTDIITE